MENKYRLYWLHGKEDVVRGMSIQEAFSAAGFGAGALRALDYYKEIPVVVVHNQETHEVIEVDNFDAGHKHIKENNWTDATIESSLDGEVEYAVSLENGEITCGEVF